MSSGKVSLKKKNPVITKASTKNKDQALQEVIGIWSDREELEDLKEFRKKVWRKTR